ncbi:MerR family transcriptional regulator [Dietzia sp. PP-33]|jgi:MerR family redox-sensitive transcriptional activator SoxR|uniref:MerR family transcriptional regulator n=1 Tax=Dietzia sp. PP-33 TaxID=2957500 RepID=UPI0029B67E78|nr:MerR family DNA-binding transcriptional regulator [Dietzia sp. PP-33]MDX2358583.1 MerR family DNA-binding transcriptional regulator [Dietzia sp. PP-33]
MTVTAPRPGAGSGESAARLSTVGDVAAKAGVAPSAVRFYDKHGVINAVRTTSNQRRFDESAPCRIQVARLAQRVGLTVREIAELFSAFPAEPEPEDWKRVADMLISQAEQRVADLKTQLDALGSGDKLCEIGARVDR